MCKVRPPQFRRTSQSLCHVMMDELQTFVNSHRFLPTPLPAKRSFYRIRHHTDNISITFCLHIGSIMMSPLYSICCCALPSPHHHNQHIPRDVATVQPTLSIQNKLVICKISNFFINLQPSLHIVFILFSVRLKFLNPKNLENTLKHV